MRTSQISKQASTAAKGPPAVIVEVDHLSFRYGEEVVLDDVNLTVGWRDFLGVIGPNGAGKTTLLRILLGLTPPSDGQIRLFGTELAQFRDWQRIGYVAQRAIAFEMRFPASVFEVVISGRTGRTGLARRFTAEDRAATGHALETVGMTAYRDRLIGQLSAGQQQRVLIARALVTGPELLVLDEPTVGVDPEAQDQFYRLLRHLNRDAGTTLILVSHDVTFVAQEVTQLACLNHALVFHGSPAEAMQSGALARLYPPSSLLVTHRH